MADVYYGVAGHPVTHSLSPVLINLVVQHVSKEVSRAKRFNLMVSDLIDAAAIQDALAWGYVKATPKPVDWDLTGAPFGKFRNRALMQKVLEKTDEIVESFDKLTNEQINYNNNELPFMSKIKLPNAPFPEEIWINLTTPLKHQLKSPAVVDFNDSSLIESVNVLRWDGFGWWSSNVDGSGVVRVAQYFGIDIASGAVIGIIGGGGSARSTARTWSKLGGKVKIFGGRRSLSDYEWFVESEHSDNSCDVLINFDDDQIPEDIDVRRFVMKSKYHLIEGDLDVRLETISNSVIDGRWLLAAQHLECWSQLWAPQIKNSLPSLDLLITKLIHAETVLSSYA